MTINQGIPSRHREILNDILWAVDEDNRIGDDYRQKRDWTDYGNCRRFRNPYQHRPVDLDDDDDFWPDE